MKRASIVNGKAAARLRARRVAIGAELAALVRDWPKYSGRYSADPAGFAKLEMESLVEFAALMLENDDETFMNIYIGEKAKQFHDPSLSDDETALLWETLLAGEKDIFLKELEGLPIAQKTLSQAFSRIEFAFRGEANHEVKILFVGDCLFLDLIGFITGPLRRDGIRMKPSFITSHVASDISSQIGKRAQDSYDLVFFSPFTYALLSDYEALFRPRVMRSPLQVMRHVRAAVANAETIFDKLCASFGCPIVVHAPAPIFRSDGSVKERLSGFVTSAGRRAASMLLRRRIAANVASKREAGKVTILIDEHRVVGSNGLTQAGRYLFRTDLQHPARFGAMLAPWYRDLIKVIAQLYGKKVVICDLDNTLWAGIIGEGLGVVHHDDRQTSLRSLKERGVLLAINSKNDVNKVTWKAGEGKLTLDDFVSKQINWQPKTVNIQSISAHLNLKPKDFVFVDDRADERALVAEAFPAITTLDALDPCSWRLLQLWADLLPSRQGADRTELYRQRDAREKFVRQDEDDSEHSRAIAMRGLALTVTLRSADAQDVNRVTDLINRTNQFNTVGSRVTQQIVEKAILNEESIVLVADAGDRFGTMGTVSVLIADRLPDSFNITSFVLSCRVFGFGIEYAILEALRKLARSRPKLRGLLVETSFNQPCMDVYDEAGFQFVDGEWIFDCKGGKRIEAPAWLTVHDANSTLDR